MTEVPTTGFFDEDDNAGFDELIAAGLAPWLVARTGEMLPSVVPGEARMPDNALDIPRLEGDFLPNMMFGPHEPEWFRPEFVLVADSDPAFSFAVTQTGEVDDDTGGPANRATLTLSLRAVMPANLVALIEKNPGLVLRPVPDLTLQLNLTVPVTGRDGATKVKAVPSSSVTAGGDGGFVVTFNLTGSAVEAAYVQLTRRGGAGLEGAATYSAYQTARIWAPDFGFPVHGPVFHGLQYELYGNGADTGTAEPINQFPGGYAFFPVTARFARTVPIGLAFGTDTYRSRFTITAEGMTRPIIDANDLDQFAGPRSEYRELTTLGDVTAKYPSLRRLYFGQVSGTVVAIPAAYGILRTAQGLQATCDSIVDESQVTGCRFHFTFTVFSMADPVDLAQLRADIRTIPEAKDRTLRVALPAGLDPHNASSLDGFPAAKAAFTDGQGQTVEVGVDIADDGSIPATTNVNLFLQQLGSTGPAPLFGNIAVRLDDAFNQPVRTQLLLNLHQTAGTDDLEISFDALLNLALVQATNRGPLDLVLHRSAAVELTNQVTVTPLGDQVLPAGKTTTLPDFRMDATYEVSRGLAVPAPLPKSAMLKYVTFHTHTVQEVQHPLTVNAAGLNFAAAGITAIDVQITITANPGTPVPAMTLSPSHQVDFVHVQVPVDSAVTGLDSTVALTLTTTAGPHTRTVSHDFIDEPILIITQQMIT